MRIDDDNALAANPPAPVVAGAVSAVPVAVEDGRAAVLAAIAWLRTAAIGEICIVADVHRGEAREMKAFATTIHRIGRVALRRGAARETA